MWRSDSASVAWHEMLNQSTAKFSSGETMRITPPNFLHPATIPVSGYLTGERYNSGYLRDSYSDFWAQVPMG